MPNNIQIVTSQVAGYTGQYQMLKLDFTYADFAAANLTNTITLYALPPNAVYVDCWMDVTQEFIGGAIATYTLSVGRPGGGNTAKIMTAQDAFNNIITYADETTKGSDLTSAGRTNLLSTSVGTNLNITATSTVANLSAATQGTVSVYLRVAQYPVA